MPIKTSPLPRQAELQRLLEYSVVTGKLYWCESRGSITKGSEAGCVQNAGYIYVGLNGKMYRAHRLIWKLVTGCDPTELIDHIDGNPTNNAWLNLREATNQQNRLNQGTYSNNTSGFKGVFWRPGCQKFEASISIHGGRIYLGYFSTAKEAHEVYRVAADKLHGKFARYE
jgi:hypothetical protein